MPLKARCLADRSLWRKAVDFIPTEFQTGRPLSRRRWQRRAIGCPQPFHSPMRRFVIGKLARRLAAARAPCGRTGPPVRRVIGRHQPMSVTFSGAKKKKEKRQAARATCVTRARTRRAEHSWPPRSCYLNFVLTRDCTDSEESRLGFCPTPPLLYSQCNSSATKFPIGFTKSTVEKG